MKIPKSPPDVRQTLSDIAQSDPNRVLQILSSAVGPIPHGRYLHWDKFKYYQAPDGLSDQEWWAAVKMARRSLYRRLPLLDKSGEHFVYADCDPIPQQLHRIDLQAGGHIQMPDQITNPETRDRYYVSSLIEEAITSSQLKGQPQPDELPRK